MNMTQFQIAMSKAPDEKTRAALLAMQPVFEAVVNFNATFVERIEASKTARGEGPTKLSKKKKQEVSGYERDAIEMESKHTENLKRFERADTIIRILYSGLESDVKSWEKSLKYFHQAELPLGQECVAVKRKLLEEMRKFLAEFGLKDDDKQSNAY